jgi:hypothetical protein
MRVALHFSLLSAQLLMYVGTWQPATAQPLNPRAIEPYIPLTAEQVVNNLIQRNVERSHALGAYQAIRVYRLDYHGFPVPEVRK